MKSDVRKNYAFENAIFLVCIIQLNFHKAVSQIILAHPLIFTLKVCKTPKMFKLFKCAQKP